MITQLLHVVQSDDYAIVVMCELKCAPFVECKYIWVEIR